MFDKENFASCFRSSFDGQVVGVDMIEPKQLESVNSENPLLDTLYAPDPYTGVPRSDLAFIMSKDSNPEVVEFIKKTLMAERPQASVTEDADLALECVKSRNETLIEYRDRIQRYLNESQPS